MLQKIRLQKGWSQEELATISGVSTRTIQRIEGGQKPSLETVKSLGAAFNQDLTHLMEDTMTDANTLTLEEKRAFKHVKALRGFYTHATIYCMVISGLILFAYGRAFYTGGTVKHQIYAFAMFGWGVGLTAHYLSINPLRKFLGADWEKRQVEKYLGRKL